jgi:hypothetical protein
MSLMSGRGGWMMAMSFGVWTTGCLLVSLVQNFKVVGVLYAV